MIIQFNNNTYNNERIDLEITMPPSLALLVDDRSADIELSNIAGLVRIEDRSGDVEGKNLRDNVFINDRSGEFS